jgi:hypothetical protein
MSAKDTTAQMVKDVKWVQDRKYFLWKIRTLEEQILHYQRLLETEEASNLENEGMEVAPLTPSGTTPSLCCTFRQFCWEHRTHQERLEYCREQLRLYQVKLATFHRELEVYDRHRLAFEQQRDLVGLGFNTLYVSSLLDWALKYAKNECPMPDEPQ